jgi:hypothetical protein
MPFKVTSANVDVINKSATVVANNQSVPNGFVQVQFPFDPPPAEAREKDQVIAIAKQTLQQALNDI